MPTNEDTPKQPPTTTTQDTPTAQDVPTSRDATANGDASEPTGHRARRVGAVGVVALSILAAFAIGRCSSPDGSDQPGPPDEAAGAATSWTCSMHPQIRQPDPGQCPICGMDLIPSSADEGEALAPNEVSLSERAHTLAKISTTPARRFAAEGSTLRLLGRVDFDETSLESVTTWMAGRIDRLHVQATGQRIRRGQLVATLYSPEVYGAHQDLITARQQLERLAESSAVARAGAEAARRSVRERLALLGIPQATIDRMEHADHPERHVEVRATTSGTVIERLATEGAYVQIGSPLYRVANLNRVWVQLDAYERDLPHLSVGQSVEIEATGAPGEVFEGRIDFIDPVLDPRRRTARVRVALPGANAQLRPGMFVDAHIHPHTAEGEAPLTIPASAVLFTGLRSLVYVERVDASRPTYEARVVQLGARRGDHYPVLAGLELGERVVTHGAFALDADLQIRGGESMMSRDDDTTRGPTDVPLNAPDDLAAALRLHLGHYLSLQTRLAADDPAGARTAARELAGSVSAPGPDLSAALRRVWEPIAAHLGARADAIARHDDIAEMRAEFEPLSREIARVLQIFGNPTEQRLRIAHCPMAFDDRGARWIQTSEVIDNAYFGDAMRTCGSFEATVQPGDRLTSGTPTARASTPSTDEAARPRSQRPQSPRPTRPRPPRPVTGHEGH